MKKLVKITDRLTDQYWITEEEKWSTYHSRIHFTTIEGKKITLESNWKWEEN